MVLTSEIYEVAPGERIEIKPLSGRNQINFFRYVTKHANKEDGGYSFHTAINAAHEVLDWLFETTTGKPHDLLDTYNLEQLEGLITKILQVSFPEGLQKKGDVMLRIAKTICGGKKENSSPPSTS